MIPRPLISTLFPYTTLFRSKILLVGVDLKRNTFIHGIEEWVDIPGRVTDGHEDLITVLPDGDRKSTRLNSSHVAISYAVFCLKKKNIYGIEINYNNDIQSYG